MEAMSFFYMRDDEMGHGLENQLQGRSWELMRCGRGVEVRGGWMTWEYSDAAREDRRRNSL